MGIAGTTSFFPSKTLAVMVTAALCSPMMTTGRKIPGIANHGMKIRYHYNDIGINSRLDTIQQLFSGLSLNILISTTGQEEKLQTDMIKLLPGAT